MSERWVVGIDGSDCARHAARWAAAHAVGRADEIELLAAWSVPTAPALPPIGPLAASWDLESFEAAAHANLQDVADELGNGDTVPIRQVVERGQSSSVLLNASHHASLLVIGSRGRGGFARLVLGSTSTQCATHADTPTVVIHADSSVTDVDRIVVAVDGSANSSDAVRWAAGFAAPGSTVECVTVWDATPIAVGADQFSFPESTELARERFEHHIEKLTGDVAIDHPGIDLHGRFIEGRVRCVLADVAAECDLLVMGARGRGAIGSAILGSVSSWLLHHSHEPVVIVPHRPRST